MNKASFRNSQELRVIPTGGALGAEIRGVDLSGPLSEETVRCLRQALLDHGVIVFHNQDISEEQQVHFTNYFGRSCEHVREQPDRPVNEVFVIDFPDGDREQVSVDGGHSPLWSPSGDELFYVDAADQLWSIEVSSDSLFRALSRTQLFSVARYSDGGSLMWRFRTTYTVEPDAEGLLFADPFRPTAGTMFVKLNIFEWLRERMGN